jgi:hypothetical protein
LKYFPAGSPGHHHGNHSLAIVCLREGHSTPEEQRRAEELERRLHVDEHGAEVRERREEDREDEEYRSRHRH